MPKLIDNIYAIKLAVLLYRDWKTWDAYKFGIIDAEGNKIADPKTSTQEASWTYLHRLAANLKRLIQKAPGGKTLIGKAVAHYALFKESLEPEGHTGPSAEEELLERFDELLVPRILGEESDHLIEDMKFQIPEFNTFIKL